MDICDYSDAGKITINSVFDACVASYTFADKEVSQTEILQMLRNLGDECETTEPTYPGTELCVVDYVIDGDTLSVFVCPDNVCTLAPLEALRIRLWHTSVNEIDYPTGAEAKAWVQDRIREGDTISFDRKGLDPYDRILAVVYSETGENINTGLIASGFGRPWTAEESALYETEIPEGGEPEEPPFGTTIEFVSVNTMPSSVNLGAQNWISATYRNTGTTSGKYWLGIRLQDEDGIDWRYTGNSDYAATIAAGEEKELWVAFTPPITLVGSLRIFLVLNKV